MSTKYIKVAVSERMPPNFTQILIKYKGGTGLDDFYYLDDLHCANTLLQEADYWLEEVPDNEADLLKENEEMKVMLEVCSSFLPYVGNLRIKVDELLNR